MINSTYDKPIGFHLVKVGGAAAKGKESYRAVLDHNAMSEEETLRELAEETHIPETTLEYYGKSIIGNLIKGTFKDGRSRNFAGLLLTRLDITGKFERIDEPYDTTKHKCVVTLLPGAEAWLARRTAPINETKPPRGRFDYITYPGGEKGFIKIGEEIHIHGHDLKLDHGMNCIFLTTLNAKGKPRFFIQAMEGLTTIRPEEMEVLENTDSFLRLAWPRAITLETIGEQTTAKFEFFDGQEKDHHNSFSRPVTILR